MADTAIPDFHQTLFDNLSSALVVLDTNFAVLDANTAMEELLTSSRDHIRATQLTLLLENNPELKDQLQRLRDSGESVNFIETRLKLVDGSHINADIHLRSGSFAHGLGLVMEIRPAERQLDIAREAALAAQQHASQAFIRQLAHEVKNPLGGLRGAAQLLEAELSTPELREYTQVIIKEADRLRSLVEHWLGPSAQTNTTSINLHQTLEHVLNLLKAEAARTVEIIQDYDPSIPELKTNRDLLIQAILNIARNALEALSQTPYSPAGKLIFRTRTLRQHTLGARVHRLVAHIQIIDDGPGIPAELQATVFHPMVSGREQGSGLGLAISQSLIGQLGGLIEFSSEPGNTQFSIYLPLATHAEKQGD